MECSEGKRVPYQQKQHERQRLAYRKQERTEPTGPKEIELYKILEKEKSVHRLKAVQVLGDEMKLTKFLHRHEYSLALWWNNAVVRSAKL